MLLTNDRNSYCFGVINNYAQWDRHTKGQRNFETESALWFLKNIKYKNENNK